MHAYMHQCIDKNNHFSQFNMVQVRVTLEMKFFASSIPQMDFPQICPIPA